MFYFQTRKYIVAMQLTLLVIFLASCQNRIPSESEEVPTFMPMPTATESISGFSERIQAKILLPIGATTVTVGGGFIWVVNSTERSVSKIDVSTGKITGSPVILEFEPREIAYGEGAVWVLSADRSRLARIDPLAHKVVAQIDLRLLQIPEYNLVLIAAGEGSVWITDQTRVIQIDPGTNQLVGEPLRTGEEIITVAAGHGTFWIGSHDDGMIARVDPVTHQVVARIEMGFSVHGLAVDEKSAWVLDEHGFAVVRIDPQTNQLQERVPIDFVGANLAAGSGSVWVAPAARDNGRFTGNDGIARIGSGEKQILETIHVGDVPESEYYAVYFADDSIWVLIVTQQMSVVKISP